MKLNKMAVGLMAASAAVGLLVSGCTTNSSAATSSSYCGYVMGNGGVVNSQAQSRDIKQVLRPGETKGYDSEYDQAKYFPCGQRNFRVANGSGDQTTPLHAWTKNGTPVDIWATMYWTPNQSETGLNNFIQFCEKYACATDSPDTNGANFSSEGWNGMLRENVGPTLQRIAERAVSQVPDAIWQNQDPALRDQVAAGMENSFSAEFQKTNGFTEDVICGSGSSGTPQQYDCQKVRIVVDGVYAQGGLQDQANQAAAAERERQLKDAQRQADIDYTNGMYGQLGPAFRACRDLGDKCKMILGPQTVVTQP